MVASRILDVPDVHEDVLVSRLLVTVHKALDRHFPGSVDATNRQFSRTLFADTASDHTAVTVLPSPEEIAAAESRGAAAARQAAAAASSMAESQGRGRAAPDGPTRSASSSPLVRFGLRLLLVLAGAAAMALWLLRGEIL